MVVDFATSVVVYCHVTYCASTRVLHSARHFLFFFLPLFYLFCGLSVGKCIRGTAAGGVASGGRGRWDFEVFFFFLFLLDLLGHPWDSVV